MVYCLFEREQEEGRKWFHTLWVTETQQLKRCNVEQIFTDLVGEHDTGLLVTEFRSQLSASLRSRPCTHTLPSQSRPRRRLRPSACTLCHCHLTTDNWCHAVRKSPKCQWRSYTCGGTLPATHGPLTVLFLAVLHLLHLCQRLVYYIYLYSIILVHYCICVTPLSTIFCQWYWVSAMCGRCIWLFSLCVFHFP